VFGGGGGEGYYEIDKFSSLLTIILTLFSNFQSEASIKN